MKIALAGNPNSGKTTMYNALTGQTEQVGNWAGVTVDKKEHSVKKAYLSGEEPLIAVDLPGAYSMSPFTSEESVTRAYILEENPDVIINIVDATNLSRSLFFTTQLLELGIPMVVALNKSDINAKKKTKIDTQKLSRVLGCPVFETISTRSDGVYEAVKMVMSVANKPQTAPYYQGDIDFSDKQAVAKADRKRFEFVNRLVSQVESRRVFTKDRSFIDKVDKLITNRWIGIPLFALIMFLVFQISQVWVGTPVADYLEGQIDKFKLLAEGYLKDADPFLSALLIDGIIGGVGAVVGFLPLVMAMYFLIALLEDCGYMSRAAVVLDPIFKKVGLSGKSVIPFVITVGCAVPGIMSSRTIRSNRERRATVMLAPFMPCGAKIPVIALFAGAFFRGAGWVSTVMYLSGIFLIFIGALLINRITGSKNRKSYFILELPEYKIPSFWGAFKSMCSRGWSYIVKAATIILLCNIIVQIMTAFSWQLQPIGEGMAHTSILAAVASPVAYLLVPLVGVLSWQLAAAAISGLVAKENVVGTLAVCFVGFDNLVNLDGFTSIAAIAYLMFNLFSPPCVAAIGAMSSEMKSAKWLWAGIGLQLGIGYTVAYMVYTIGTLIVKPASLSLIPAIGGGIAVLVFVLILALLVAKGNRKVVEKAEYAVIK